MANSMECVLSRFSHAWLHMTLWTVPCQTPLSMGFPRQEYWSGLPFPSPGDLPDPGIEPLSPALAGGFITTSATREAQNNMEVPEKLKIALAHCDGPHSLCGVCFFLYLKKSTFYLFKKKNRATIWSCSPTLEHIFREKHDPKDTCLFSSIKCDQNTIALVVYDFLWLLPPDNSTIKWLW